MVNPTTQETGLCPPPAPLPLPPHCWRPPEVLLQPGASWPIAANTAPAHTAPESQLFPDLGELSNPVQLTSPGWKSPVNRILCSTYLSQFFNSVKRIGLLVFPSFFRMLKSKLPLKSTKGNLHWLGCMPNHQEQHQDAQAIY